MAEILNEVELAVWTPGTALELPALSSFVLPVDAQRALEEATRRSVGRTTEPMLPSLAGLSEILAWFVPDMAFMRMDWDGDVRMKRLRLYFLGDRSGDEDVQVRIRAGLSAWLAIAHGDVPVTVRQAVGAAPADPAHWSLHAVTRELSYPGICPVPSELLLFDAIIAKAVAVVQGGSFSIGQHHGRSFVPRILQKRPVSGLELVVFPPVKADNDSFWTEVVTLRAATFPERSEIHLLARTSIRNWGPVRSVDRWEGPTRSLDVFMPVNGGNRTANVSFAFRSRREGKGKEAPIQGWWKAQKSRRVFDLIHRLTGNALLCDRDVTEPQVDPSGLWVLPRRAPGSRDKYSAGGSGVGWIDRAILVDVLNSRLAGAGFEKAAPMKRHRGRQPIEKPFARRQTSSLDDEKACRAAMLKALAAMGNANNTLEVLVLHTRDETPRRVRDAIVKFLGAPTQDDGGVLGWDDGLRFVIVSAPAQEFAQALPDGALSADERERFTENQMGRVLVERRQQEQERVADLMTAHVRSVRTRPEEIGCAILEMPAALRDKPNLDPYPMARNRLAREKVLPQVLLVDEIEDKYESAARDLVRMLGVFPTGELDLAPAAITILQRNEDWRGGRRQSPVALAVAGRVRGGLLECALPDGETAEPQWMTYPAAMLRIMVAAHDGLDRGRSFENRARHEHFFGRALESIDKEGPSVVLIDGSKVRLQLEAFRNGGLHFDQIKLGTRTFTPTDLPNTRIVRLGLDPSEQPFHFHRNETKWPSGIFCWEGQTRTAYGIKTKPQTVKGKALNATQLSRHEEDGTNKDRSWPRVHAPLDEMCVMFQPQSDDAMQTATLVDRLRQVHAQYDSSTKAPFPLHELQLLAKGFTFDRDEDLDDDGDEAADDDA